jgi:probable F420-dependent oxidoreductase
LSVLLPTYSAVDPGGWDLLFDQARAAEDAGIDRVVVSDHVVFGEHIDGYSNPATGGVTGGRQPTGPDGHWLEPLTVLSMVAARTVGVRLGTYVLLAALRRPVVLAKQVATLDVLSGGRVDLGVGIGWQREEYSAAGLDWSARGRLLDHTLAVCQALWRDQRATFADSELRFDGIHQMPKPIQPGGVPIWIGGRCNDGVARRLARFASGWIPWGDDAGDPAGSIPRMREAVDAAGGDGATLAVLAPVVVRVGDHKAPNVAATVDAQPALVDAAVTDVLLQMRPPRSYDDAVELYTAFVSALD